MSLDGKRIVIIGGSSGIGLATARMAAARGAALVLGGRRQARLDEAVASIGAVMGATGVGTGRVETCVIDATEEAAMATLFAGIGAFDHLCVLVPSAPDANVSARLVPFLQQDPAVFETIFRNRFWTQCWGARYGAPHIRAGGSILFMSNSQPRKPITNYSPSCAAAGAIESLMRILAVELAPIRVNVIAPGFVQTPGTGHIPPERRAAWDRIAQTQPVPRLADPQEIAAGILFLMENGFTTGATLDIDGGYRFT
jgi:NAD(P)-dependent dehydrogenase (short-subunit alcohol dehydrogenase family)